MSCHKNIYGKKMVKWMLNFKTLILNHYILLIFIYLFNLALANTLYKEKDNVLELEFNTFNNMVYNKVYFNFLII